MNRKKSMNRDGRRPGSDERKEKKISTPELLHMILKMPSIFKWECRRARQAQRRIDQVRTANLDRMERSKRKKSIMGVSLR